MARDTDSQQPAKPSNRQLMPEERVALAQHIRAMTPAEVTQTDSAELIREDRDSR